MSVTLNYRIYFNLVLWLGPYCIIQWSGTIYYLKTYLIIYTEAWFVGLLSITVVGNVTKLK